MLIEYPFEIVHEVDSGRGQLVYLADGEPLVAGPGLAVHQMLGDLKLVQTRSLGTDDVVVTLGLERPQDINSRVRREGMRLVPYKMDPDWISVERMDEAVAAADRLTPYNEELVGVRFRDARITDDWMWVGRYVAQAHRAVVKEEERTRW